MAISENPPAELIVKVPEVFVVASEATPSVPMVAETPLDSIVGSLTTTADQVVNAVTVGVVGVVGVVVSVVVVAGVLLELLPPPQAEIDRAISKITIFFIF
jgi:hypothetical protein